MYGYRRLKVVYERKYSRIMNHKKILRIMREMGIKAIQRRKRKNYNQSTAVIMPNVLNQHFSSAKLNRKLCTDITCFIYNSSRLYLSVILDLYNREVVSYQISKHNDNELVISTIQKAFEKIELRGAILHSDQGSQYTTTYYHKLLESKGIIQSMSRKGNCLDNAPIECFFSHLKSETIYTKKYKSEKELIIAIKEYIKYYNEQRLQRKLNYLSPVQYRYQKYIKDPVPL